MGNEVVIKESQDVAKVSTNSPADMIRMAVEGKADLTQLRELLSLQKEWEANEARKVFASSFALAQENITAVSKNKLNPQTHSKYADLGDIIETVKPIYTKEGFSIIFYEGVTSIPEHIRICADVLHTAGHKESYYYDVPLDGVGIKGNANMTKIHAKASSTSYARRYLMCMIWNIPTQDDDGNVAGNTVGHITEEQAQKIRDRIVWLEASEPSFLKYLGIEKLEDMLVTDLPKAEAALKAKEEGKKKA